MGVMKAWRFSTDDLPQSERQAAWRGAMIRLRLPVGDQPAREPFWAAVTCLSSPLGMEFALVSATPQSISGRNRDQPAAIWLAVLLEGSAILRDSEGEVAIRPGDIVYGPTGMAATLALETRFRLLFITAPRVALDHRLIAPLSLTIGHLSAASGVNHVFSGLMRATAEVLSDLSSDQLRPVELALTEFLVASLATEGSGAVRGGAAAARAAHLHRVRQRIETMLSDPELTLKRVAEEDGVSPRSLQKLFASAHQSFRCYLRGRRLERCRLDLTSPSRADLSISAICFSWGFNGAAHFSRAFRDRYGVSPRAYRRAASPPLNREDQAG